MNEGVKRYIIKPHARLQMERRQITENQIRTVLSNPGQILTSSSGRKIFQTRLTVGKRDYLFRAFVEMDKVPPEVVTVYRTSKINKYWR